MHNIVRQPVRGEDFFERPKLIKKIRKALDSKLPILLKGPIKSGKTSILFYLMDILDEYYHFVYIDVGFISNGYQYLNTIYEKINNLSIAWPSTLEKNAELDDIDRILSSYKDEKPLVIMIDNFSDGLKNIYINKGPEDPKRLLNFDRELRNLSESNYYNARFIYTDSLDLEKIAKNIGRNHLINDLYTINIPPLSENEAVHLIKALTVNMDFKLHPDDIKYLCNRLQWLNPFQIQLFLFELDNIYTDQNLTSITNSDIDEALKRASKQGIKAFLNVPAEEKKEVIKEFKNFKIQRVKIQNIKCFEDVEINFDPSGNTGLIIGTNGKGKSTILQLIALGLSGVSNVPFTYNWKEVVKKNHDRGSFEIDGLYDNNPIHLKFEIDSKDDSITCIEGSDQLKSLRDTFMLLAYGVNRSYKLEEAKPYKDIEPIATLFGENAYLKHIKVAATYEYARKNAETIQALINKVLGKANGDDIVILNHYDPTSFYFKTPSNPQEVIPIEALSEGFKSTLVWFFDAIIRIVERGGSLENAADVTGIILLDEIDLHLHPTWQRTILESVETLFPNIQFIVTSHSPFVVQSAKKECLIALEMEKDSGNVVVVDKNITSELSYSAIVDEIFNISFPFSREIEQKMDKFREMANDLRDNKPIDEKKFKKLVLEIASKGVELEGIMRRELMTLKRRTGKTFNLWKK